MSHVSHIIFILFLTIIIIYYSACAENGNFLPKFEHTRDRAIGNTKH